MPRVPNGLPAADRATPIARPPVALVVKAAAEPMDYRSFFELSGEMLATANLDGCFTTVNDSFERVLGYADDELLARPLHEFVHPAEREAMLAELAELAKGTRLVGFECRFRAKDGSYRWLLWSATPSLEEGRIYAVALDMTEVRAQDEALARVVADLERSNEELSQFAYVASHDLSEPLRVVAGHVELLAHRYRGRLDDDADRYIEFAVEGCSRMRHLIDDLLAFSRAGREPAVDEEVDLNEVAIDALASLDEIVSQTGAVITIDEMPVVVGAGGQLGQVLTNLVANSLKFSREGRRTTCGDPRRARGRWLEDRGGGRRDRRRARVPSADLPDLPTPAQPRCLPRHRHRAGHLPKDGGAARRADLVRSGRAARRPVLLHDPGPDGAPSMSSAQGREIQILLVEDSAGDVSLTREALRDARVANELNVVGDGVEALAYLRGEGPYAERPTPDFVLLDLNLPRKDGREVLEEMKNDDALKHIPVVVLTTSSSDTDILNSYQLHANAFVTKPVAFGDFLAAVRQLEGFWLEIVKLPESNP